MRKETYYINDLTGEVFTTEKECINNEKESAINLVEQVKDAYHTVEKYCNNAYCGQCPFLGLTKDTSGASGCIRDWFDRDYIRDLGE